MVSGFWQNKLTMFGAHCPVNSLTQLAESKAKEIGCIPDPGTSKEVAEAILRALHRFNNLASWIKSSPDEIMRLD